MARIELDTEYVVADEAFDIHPPHPDVQMSDAEQEAQDLELLGRYAKDGDPAFLELSDEIASRRREMLRRPPAERFSDIPF